MAGSSGRRGAVRKPGSKKGATVGSGGQRRKGLEAKGPTPKAEDRVGHPAARRAKAKAKTQAKAERSGQPRTARQDPQVVVGRNPVLAALNAGVPSAELLVATGIDVDDRVSQALGSAAAQGITTSEVPRRDLDALAGGDPHQGLVLRVSEFAYTQIDTLLAAAESPGPPAVLVALDGVTDPHNLGAIARSAAAFDAAGLVIPARRAAGVTAAAWRASAGAVAQLPVAQVSNLANTVAQAQRAGFFVMGLAGEADQSLDEAAAHFSDVPVLLVVGSEGAGLSRLVAERADALVRIPLSPQVESLNASVAAGVALYALRRERDSGR